jgi:hypothetical protein
MRLISLLFLMVLTQGFRLAPTYQVISAHPHDVDDLKPFIETVRQEGRFWEVRLRPGIPRHLLTLVRPLQGNELGSRMIPRRKTVTPANPEITTLVRLVDENKIKADVIHLSSYRNRSAGSEDNRQAVNWTEDRLKGLGYQTQQICYRTGVCSVIADKLATTESNKTLLVLAHVDSVGRAFAGADDNASGTAVLLEMARVMANSNLRKNLRFFVTNGEENGLLGAKHYVRELEKAGTLEQISLALNMDMVGFNERNGIVELETNSPYEAVALKFADHAHTYTTLKTKVTLNAWGSDHVPFLEKRVPALLTIENWDTKTPCYHAACDKPETLNYAYAAEIGRMNVAAIMDEGLKR